MVIYNAALGVDHNTVNDILSQLYTTLKPSGLFKISRDINQVHITSASFSIEQAPTVDFRDAPVPPEVIDEYRKAFNANPPFAGQPDAKKDLILKDVIDRFAKIWFIITLPSNKVTLEYEPRNGKAQDATVIECSLTAYGLVTVTVGDKPTIDFDAIAGHLQTLNPDDPRIDAIANNALLPWMIESLNKDYLYPISLPVIEPIPGLGLSIPEPAVQSGDLVVYTALGKTSPDIPTPFSKWPKGVFVAVDAALISAAANAAIKQIAMPHAGFNWTVFSGGVGATLGPVTGVNIIDDNSGNITVAMDASAYAELTIELPSPFKNHSIGVKLLGDVAATANAHAKGSELYLNIIDIGYIHLKAEIPDLPEYVKLALAILGVIVDGLEDALLDIIRPLIDAILKQIQIPVYRIPQIPVPLKKDLSFHIELDNINTTELNPAGDRLLVAYGAPKILA